MRMNDLYALIEQHKLHLKFLQNNMCSEDDKIEIVDEMKRIFGIVKGRSRYRSEGGG